MTASRTILVGGGARSGKSRFALGYARKLGSRRAFVATARGEDHLALVRDLLDGRPVEGIAGLTMDTELRWSLVRSLAPSASRRCVPRRQSGRASVVSGSDNAMRRTSS